jgi:hypothetical protein
MAKAKAEKVWIVEQRWDVGPAIVPIRSVVKAVTRKDAERGAPEAIRLALVQLTGRTDPPGKAASAPVVLYAAGPGDLVADAPSASRGHRAP